MSYYYTTADFAREGFEDGLAPVAPIIMFSPQGSPDEIAYREAFARGRAVAARAQADYDERATLANTPTRHNPYPDAWPEWDDLTIQDQERIIQAFIEQNGAH